MKQATIYTFLLVICAPLASAQTPDTTSAQRYFPLEVGSVWEYERYTEECDFEGFCFPPRLTGYTRWSVLGEELIGGTTYFELWDERFLPSGELESDGRRIRRVRFDPVAAYPKELVDDQESVWPTFFTCRFDAPFDANLDSDCGARTSGGYDLDLDIGEDTLATALKTFVGVNLGYTFGADVGMTSIVSVFWSDPTYFFSTDLSYARIGGQEYGSRRFPPLVNAEPAPDASALPLSVYPNPSPGNATVRLGLDAPQRGMLAVYDVLGQRVLSDDLGVRAAGEVSHRLDTARLPAGVYLVRLTGDAGATAIARLVRQ